MLGLSAAQVVASHDGASQAQAARQFAGQVRQDVRIEVLGHQNVETLGVAHQVGGGCVDQQVVKLDFREFLGHVASAFQEQTVRHVEAVGLVNGCHLLAALHGQLERAAGDAVAAVAGDFAHGQCHVGRGHHFTPSLSHVAVRVEAFGGFTHDDQVHGLAGLHVGLDEWTCAGRAHVSIQVQLHTEGCGDVVTALFGTGVVSMGLCAQDDAVVAACSLQCLIAQRGAVLFECREADVVIVVGEAEVELRVSCLQHADSCINDFRANAVAGENQEFHGMFL